MNLPNFLSLTRILLLLPIIIFFEYSFYAFSAFTFFIASLTDYLDGYIARKKNITSQSGAMLDLLADKIFVSTLLVWLTFNFDNLVILISSILIISREISISYVRMYMILEFKELSEIKSNFLGKFKTTFQLIGIGLILITPLTPQYIFNFSLVLIFLSSLISWYSFVEYLNNWIRKSES